jgi:hypothetical protein
MTIKLIKQDWLQEGTVWCSPDMYELLKARVEVGASLEPIDTTPIVIAEGVVEAIADAFKPIECMYCGLALTSTLRKCDSGKADMYCEAKNGWLTCYGN